MVVCGKLYGLRTHSRSPVIYLTTLRKKQPQSNPFCPLVDKAIAEDYHLDMVGEWFSQENIGLPIAEFLEEKLEAFDENETMFTIMIESSATAENESSLSKLHAFLLAKSNRVICKLDQKILRRESPYRFDVHLFDQISSGCPSSTHINGRTEYDSTRKHGTDQVTSAFVESDSSRHETCYPVELHAFEMNELPHYSETNSMPEDCAHAPVNDTDGPEMQPDVWTINKEKVKEINCSFDATFDLGVKKDLQASVTQKNAATENVARKFDDENEIETNPNMKDLLNAHKNDIEPEAGWATSGENTEPQPVKEETRIEQIGNSVEEQTGAEPGEIPNQSGDDKIDVGDEEVLNECDRKDDEDLSIHEMSLTDSLGDDAPPHESRKVQGCGFCGCEKYATEYEQHHPSGADNRGTNDLKTEERSRDDVEFVPPTTEEGADTAAATTELREISELSKDEEDSHPAISKNPSKCSQLEKQHEMNNNCEIFSDKKETCKGVRGVSLDESKINSHQVEGDESKGPGKQIICHCLFDKDAEAFPNFNVKDYIIRKMKEEMPTDVKYVGSRDLEILLEVCSVEKYQLTCKKKEGQEFHETAVSLKSTTSVGFQQSENCGDSFEEVAEFAAKLIIQHHSLTTR